MTWKIWRKVFLFFYVRELPPLLFPVHATSRLYSPTILLYLPLSLRLMVWVHYCGCPVLSVVKIDTNTLKAKIPKECLYTALLSSSSVSHHVSIWRNKLPKPFILNHLRKTSPTPTPISLILSPLPHGTVVVSTTASPTFNIWYPLTWMWSFFKSIGGDWYS